jgi:hypothetical protein
VSGEVWFISHAGADRAWAEWVAWQLLDAGYQVELDYWDWGAGDNFILKMSAALERGQLLALFSLAYSEPERFTTPEWTSMVAMREKITPVRLSEVEAPAILRPLLSKDLFGLSPVEARRVLLEAVNGPSRPTIEPPFPGPAPDRGGCCGRWAPVPPSCRGVCRGCGTFLPATRPSLAATASWFSYARPWRRTAGWQRRPCTAAAVWARRNSLSSTRTG